MVVVDDNDDSDEYADSDDSDGGGDNDKYDGDDDDDDGNDSEESMGAHTGRSTDVKVNFLPATIKWFCHQHRHQRHYHH